MPLSRWLYSRDHLTTWLEEHLAAQADDGALHDWIALGPAEAFREWAPRVEEAYRAGDVVLSADTNTTEADQEASAALAAYDVWRAVGDDAWLRKHVGGRRVLDRLSAALRSVLDRRLDARRGLVVNALTADWGDVSPIYPDQRAIYVDEATPLAAGLYTNALVHGAALALGEMHEAVGEGGEASAWRARASGLRGALERQLWQEKAGFFRLHVVTTPDRAKGFPDDRDVFALGGHAVALLSGEVSDARAARIFDVAEARRREHGVSTIAGVLLPPYAEGVFRHPAMAKPWQYQNGGQWDWFGGRFVLAEFRRGRAVQARAHLSEMARRAVAAGGLYEWYTRDGAGQGSPRYAGSAGALGAAVLEGLFGVELRGERLDLRIRLGDLEGGVDLTQPANGATVAYRYEPDLAAGRLVVSYRSSAEGAGRLAILLPPGAQAAECALDAAPLGCPVERVGEDTYAVVETDWRPHRLAVRLATATSPRP